MNVKSLLFDQSLSMAGLTRRPHPDFVVTAVTLYHRMYWLPVADVPQYDSVSVSCISTDTAIETTLGSFHCFVYRYECIGGQQQSIANLKLAGFK